MGRPHAWHMEQPSRKLFSYDRNLVTGMMWLLVSALATAITTFLVARLLPQETYGEFQFFVSAMMLTMIFSLPGAKTAIIQSVARGYDWSLVAGTKARLKYSLIGMAILLIAGGCYLWVDRPMYALCFAVLAACYPFYHAFTSFMDYQLAKHRFRQAAHHRIFITLCCGAAVVVAAWFEQPLPVLLLVYLGLTGAFHVWYYYLAWRQLDPAAPRDPQLETYSRQMGFNVAVPLVTAQVDRPLLFWLIGAEGLAVYSIAISIPEQLASMSNIFKGLVLPGFSRLKNNSMIGQSRRRLLLPGLLCLAGSLLGIILVPYVLHVLFDGKYDSAAGPAQLAFVGLAMIAPERILEAFLESRKAVRELHLLHVVAAVAKMGVFLAAVPFMGLWGAVLSLVVMRSVSFVYSWSLAFSVSQDQRTGEGEASAL